jgi:hypothetical protein
MKIAYTLLFAASFTITQGYSNKKTINNNPINIVSAYNQSESNLNNALLELVEGINPKAFNKSWKTEANVWKEKVKSAADVSTLSSSYLTLVEQIKPKYFKPNWEKSKEKWVKQVKEARSNLALAGLLKTFYSNLNPDTFTKDWPSKGAQWVESLNKIE